MNSTEELYHSVLQKMIMMVLGLLTVGVLLTSCAPMQNSCAAYNAADITEQTEHQSCE